MHLPPKSSPSAQNNWSYYDQQYAAGAQPRRVSVSSPGGLGQAGSRVASSGRTGRSRPPWVKWAGLLAFIILLAALGSSRIFAGGNSGPAGQPTPVPTHTGAGTPIARSSPTAAGVTPTATVQATPSPTPTGGPFGPLPATWIASGRGNAEAIEVKDVAETFVSHYETLDWRSKNTFDQATFAMTAAALARFWKQDERATPAFIENFIDTQSVWVASVGSARTQIIKAKAWQHAYFAWLSVSYQLYHQQKGAPAYTDEHTIVMLMVAVPFGVNSVVGGIGWEVSAWQDGYQPFPIPDQP